MFFSLHVLHKLPKRSRSLQIARVTPCRNAETLETFAKEHQAMTSFSWSSRPAVDPFRNEETMIKSNWNCHVNIIIVSYCISISKHYNVTICYHYHQNSCQHEKLRTDNVNDNDMFDTIDTILSIHLRKNNNHIQFGRIACPLCTAKQQK